MGIAREQFAVGGMSCSFCAESIRKAYDRTDGVGDRLAGLADGGVEVVRRYVVDDDLDDIVLVVGRHVRDALDGRQRALDVPFATVAGHPDNRNCPSFHTETFPLEERGRFSRAVRWPAPVDRTPRMLAPER